MIAFVVTGLERSMTARRFPGRRRTTSDGLDVQMRGRSRAPVVLEALRPTLGPMDPSDAARERTSGDQPGAGMGVVTSESAP
jgi:hypothetical protein